MGKFILYRSQQKHHADCERFPYEQIPVRIFLDTNIVSCLVKWRECVFEMQETPSEIDQTLASDIESLMHVFQVGARAYWDILASDKTIAELSRTSNIELREDFLDYGSCLVGYGAVEDVSEDRAHANDLARRLRNSVLLSALPDLNDRDLIAHAISMRCDTFCTRDRRTIHRHREKLHLLPIRILTPAEWWQQIKPWAGLWC